MGPNLTLRGPCHLHRYGSKQDFKRNMDSCCATIKSVNSDVLNTSACTAHQKRVVQHVRHNYTFKYFFHETN